MQLRLLLLVGWKKGDDGNLSAPRNLYLGVDGVALQAAALAAQKEGGYIALRRFINPSGIPCPVVVDPVPTVTKVEAPKAKTMEPQQNKSEAQLKLEEEKKAQEDKRQEAALKDAADVAAINQNKLFTDLNAKTKAQLTELLNDLNSDLEEKDRRKPETSSKIDLINTILLLQGKTKKIIVR
jgi:hypothetical protein